MKYRINKTVMRNFYLYLENIISFCQCIFLLILSSNLALLKHTETMCDTVVENGGLRSLIYACRSSDLPSLRHAAVCLMSLALFGGSGSHSEMMRQHAIEWLFCLAFHQDEVIKYFACLTSAVLSTNP